MKKIVTTSLLISLLLPVSYAEASTKSLNTKANKAACKNIKTKYQSESMSKWSNGLVADQDVLKEIDLNIKMLIIRQKNTNGKIKTVIDSWIATEKSTKDALVKKDVVSITNAMSLKIKSIAQFDKICKSIGA